MDRITGLTGFFSVKKRINIDGLSDTTVTEKIGHEFGIHSLVLEDILSTHQRPKLEEYDGYLYFVVKGISVNGSNEFKPKYYYCRHYYYCPYAVRMAYIGFSKKPFSKQEKGFFFT